MVWVVHVSVLIYWVWYRLYGMSSSCVNITTVSMVLAVCYE